MSEIKIKLAAGTDVGLCQENQRRQLCSENRV